MAERGERRRRVRRLFIVDYNTKETESIVTNGATSISSNASTPRIPAAHGEIYFADVLNSIDLAYLESLSIFLAQDCFNDRSLPALSFLSGCQMLKSFFLHTSLSRDFMEGNGRDTVLEVEQLHIAGDQCSPKHFDRFPGELAPKLQHLKFSDYSFEDGGRLIRVLRRFIHRNITGDGEPLQGEPKCGFPTSLKSITVSVAPFRRPMDGSSDGNWAEHYRGLLRELEDAIAEQDVHGCDDGRGRVILLPPREQIEESDRWMDEERQYEAYLSEWLSS